MMRYCVFLQMLFFSIFAWAKEKAILKFDGREWEQASSLARSPDDTFDEYVLKGDNVESWRELVTIQFFPLPEHVKAEAFVAAMKAGFKQNCTNVSWKELSLQEGDIIYEVDLSSCAYAGSGEEHILSRVIRTTAGIHSIHYNNRSTIPEDLKKTWTKLLREVQIINEDNP